MTRLIWKAASAGAVAVLLGVPTAWAGGSLGVSVAQQQDPGQDGDDQADGSAMVVRVGRLESQIRTLTGQIEQLQFQNRKLEDDLRKMQGDVDFRFQDLQRQGGAAAPRPIVPQKRTDADGGLPSPADAAPAPGTATPGTPDVPRTKVARGDAFDPSSDPNAPGAPKPLGSTAPSQPLARAARPSDAPLDLMQRPATAASGEPDPGRHHGPQRRAARPQRRSRASLPAARARSMTPTSGSISRASYDGAASGFQNLRDQISARPSRAGRRLSRGRELRPTRAPPRGGRTVFESVDRLWQVAPGRRTRCCASACRLARSARRNRPARPIWK